MDGLNVDLDTARESASFAFVNFALTSRIRSVQPFVFCAVTYYKVCKVYSSLDSSFYCHLLLYCFEVKCRGYAEETRI